MACRILEGNPAYADPFYSPPPKPTEIPIQVIPREILDSDIGF